MGGGGGGLGVGRGVGCGVGRGVGRGRSSTMRVGLTGGASGAGPGKRKKPIAISLIAIDSANAMIQRRCGRASAARTFAYAKKEPLAGEWLSGGFRGQPPVAVLNRLGLRRVDAVCPKIPIAKLVVVRIVAIFVVKVGAVLSLAPRLLAQLLLLRAPFLAPVDDPDCRCRAADEDVSGAGGTVREGRSQRT